jgi:CRISPR/Cas system-associated protein Cas10 (large subunit of type III CRISPR-Cas system)
MRNKVDVILFPHWGFIKHREGCLYHLSSHKRNIVIHDEFKVTLLIG